MPSIVVTDDDVVSGMRTLTLNRPDRRNALDLDAWLLLGERLREAGRDPSVRVVVLTGSGKGFCAGADLTARRDGHPLTRVRAVSAVAEQLFNFVKPTIAQVHGAAVGGGFNLALCCDFVLASEDAFFSQVFARRGLSVDVGGSFLLPRLVGLRKAKELTMLGDRLSAAEAERLGLLTGVVSRQELDATVRSYAQRLASGPPIALSLTKSLLHQGSTSDLSSALESESQAQAVNFAGGDVAEGYRAFIEGDSPTFSGEWRVPPM